MCSQLTECLAWRAPRRLEASIWVREQYLNTTAFLKTLVRESKLCARETCIHLLKIITVHQIITDGGHGIYRCGTDALQSWHPKHSSLCPRDWQKMCCESSSGFTKNDAERVCLLDSKYIAATDRLEVDRREREGETG